MKKIMKHVKVYALLGTFAVLASACCSVEYQRQKEELEQAKVANTRFNEMWGNRQLSKWGYGDPSQSIAGLWLANGDRSSAMRIILDQKPNQILVNELEYSAPSGYETGTHERNIRAELDLPRRHEGNPYSQVYRLLALDALVHLRATGKVEYGKVNAASGQFQRMLDHQCIVASIAGQLTLVTFDDGLMRDLREQKEPIEKAKAPFRFQPIQQTQDQDEREVLLVANAFKEGRTWVEFRRDGPPTQSPSASAPAESAPEVQDGKDVEAPLEIGDKRRTLADILRDLSVPSTDNLHSEWIPYLEKSIEIGKPALREHLRVLTMISAYDEGWDYLLNACRSARATMRSLHGWVGGQGFPDAESQKKWNLFEERHNLRELRADKPQNVIKAIRELLYP